ncbi:MAG: thiamine-monophosphate kinase [Phycisphaeraceae bacterium]|nr:thiamine-monophosphate kinase [Phycisphaeraceae bacterium]
MNDHPLSESDLHRHFGRRGRDLPGRVLLPPGDDMAMLGIGSTDRLLVAADQVVIGRHVRVDEAPAAIGRKAVLRNLSDVAAMAARPIAILATATLSPDRDQRWAEALHAGLHETGLAFDAPLIGGDLATHARPETPDVISVTILARPGGEDGRVVTRHGAAAGDLLAVTGRLGGSLTEDGRGRHLDFPPRIEEAITLNALLRQDLVAMMDVSDGVARDAARLATTDGVGVRLDADRIPRNPGCDWRSAIGDGEDYELLIACRREPPGEIDGVPVTVIGRFESTPGTSGRVLIDADGESIDVAGLGWEHAGDPTDRTG